MAEPSLWHRLNPFHHRPANARPPSTLRDYTTPDTDGTSSIDTSVPVSSEDDGRSNSVYTPAFPTSPLKHARTPSILRSLAHHPSLSALRSKSKKSRRKTAVGRSPIPPMPDRGVKDSLDIHGGDDERGYDISPSPKKLRRKGSLKEAKSMPRDMRINPDATYTRPSMDVDPFHPVPSPHELSFNFNINSANVTKLRPKKHNRDASTASVIRRKPIPAGIKVPADPAPSVPPRSSARATPDITVNAMDVTPESVKVRRMRFRLDLDMDNSPPSISRLSASSMSHGSRRRERSASTSEVIGDSPSRGTPQTSRHLSSPAPPSPFKSQYASAYHPFTTQHPHPVPLTVSPRPSYDASPTLYASNEDSDDFVPLTQSGRTMNFDDGLDTLVTDREMPKGTPGGKRADLRRGALVDGSKHEKNAIRFFSRDMYEPASSTPSPASLRPVTAQSAADMPGGEDRSESPFEVKLSAMVTKRMSLDAFGTPSPSVGIESVTPPADVEELVEEDEEAEDADENDHEDEEGADAFDKTELSTIIEGSSGNDSADRSGLDEQATGKTRYYTPDSRDVDALPSTASTASPFLPPRRQHASCPPLPVARSFIRAQGNHAKALSHELSCAKRLIREMEKELDEVRQRLQKAEEADEEEKGYLSRMKELEELLAERDEEFDDINAQIESQASEHGLTVTQLRGALEDNEGYFDTLQEAHDELADKLADLETDHAELTMERARDAHAYEASRREVEQLRASLERRAAERSQVESAIFELQRELHHAEESIERQKAEHQQTIDAKVRELDEIRSELAKISSILRQKEERVAELEDLLRAGLEREGEIAKLNVMLRTRDERIHDLENRQTDRQRALAERDEVVAGKDSTIAGLNYRVEEMEMERCKMEKDLRAALQSVSAKDMIIGVLRDKQRTAGYEKDEVIAAGLGAKKEYEQKEEVMRGEVEALRRELEGVRTELRTMQEEMAEFEDDKANWEEERAELRHRLEEASDLNVASAELQEQLQQALNDLASTQESLGNAQEELGEVVAELEAKTKISEEQEEELEELRAALYEAEESAEDIGDGFLRRAQQAEQQCEQLRAELADLQGEHEARAAAVSKAMIEAEMERATASDLRSRLASFTAEVDRLSLVNAELKKKADDVRRSSSSDEFKLVELEKRVESLQQDQELLNVALESKELELVLLQRQLGKGTPASRQKTLASSTSRVARAHGADVTPMPTKRLSKSVSSTSLRPLSRASSVCSTPTPAPVMPASSARARSVVTPSPAPLGASSRHNRTPERKVVAKKVVSGMVGAAVVQPAISRRSSLPVMKGSSVDLGRSRGLGMDMGRVGEEDEA